MADPQKTEQATKRRLQKAREEGNFASSRQFIAGAHFLAFVALVHMFGARWVVSMRSMMSWTFASAFGHDLTLNSWLATMWRITLFCGVPVLIAAASLLALNIGLQLGLTKMGFSFKKLAPNFERLSPGAKLRQLPRQNFPAFLQAVILLPVCGLIVYLVLSNNLKLLTLPLRSIEAAQADVFGSFSALLWRAAGVFFVFGCVDLFREKRHHMSDLRMSKQEIRDEQKETDGNPHMKMRIRRLQRDQARKRMMQQVPKATAVIVNPTHFAVALRYEPETMAAPIVVAKGKDFIALRIRQIALDHQVPLIENPPLARGLYKAAEIGQEIPPHLYKAVAEILAYIFRLMHRR